ncbi:MAG TPA: hypothetical protein DCF87_01860 [Opitutae bacterium]|nr:hypothetical protein [Opitutae bacterium]
MSLNKTSKVSVVIPCYNAQGTIRRALLSALSNDGNLDHVFLIDNNSTDGTLDLLKELAVEFAPLVSVHIETRKGACWARNKGLSYVESKWVQFLDADDVISSTKLSNQANYGEENELDIVVSPFLLRAPNGNVRQSPDIEFPTHIGLMRGSMGTTISNLFRTSAVREVGGWNPEWTSAQEYELMFRLFQNGANFGRLNLYLSTYFVGVLGSISSGSPAMLRANSLNLRLEMFKEFIGLCSDPRDIQKLMNGLFVQVRWLYPWNKGLALSGWELLRSKGFQPRTDEHLPASYCITFRFLGFPLTEKIRIKLQRLRRTFSK